MMTEDLETAGYILIALGAIKLVFAFFLCIAVVVFNGFGDLNAVVPVVVLVLVGAAEIFAGNQIKDKQKCLLFGLIVCGAQLLAFPIGTILCWKPFRALLGEMRRREEPKRPMLKG